MKRILFITMNLNSGGAERQIVTTAYEFKRRGFEVEIACFYDGDFYLTQLQKNDIKVHWMIVSNPIKRIYTFRKFIRRGNYDAVISYLESSNILNILGAIGSHSWKVITGERSAKEDHLVSTKGRIMGLLQRYADVIVCNSNNARNLWIKHYQQYEPKLKTIYNTVLVLPSKSEYEVRKNGKLHILVAASYQRIKNPINLIEAVNLLDDCARNGLCIDWYGERDFAGSVAIACDQLIEKYKLDNVIHFHDRTNNIPCLMSMSDVVGLFSSVEGLPNTICEGMVLGKPIIMTRVSDYCDLVSDDNGWLCDWDDVNSISKALYNAIYCKNEKLISMGLNSANKSKILFSPESNINKWIDVINN